MMPGHVFVVYTETIMVLFPKTCTLKPYEAQKFVLITFITPLSCD